MTITEVSEKYDVSPNTLRYYERIGLMPRVHRNKSGVRDFTEENCRWVEFILCMRWAGISIEMLAEYVELYGKGEATAAARKAMMIEQRDQLQERVDMMTQTLNRLNYKIDNFAQTVLKAERSLDGANNHTGNDPIQITCLLNHKN